MYLDAKRRYINTLPFLSFKDSVTVHSQPVFLMDVLIVRGAKNRRRPTDDREGRPIVRNMPGEQTAERNGQLSCPCVVSGLTIFGQD